LSPGEQIGISADAWYQHTTRRIDGLRLIEEQMSDELGRLCAIKLREALSDETGSEIARTDALIGAAPIAVLFAEAAPSRKDVGVEGGIGLYGLDPTAPMPMRSILNVVEAQSRLINDVSAQLESARAALTERKLIDRAKGLLMDSRGISEKAAYALMRETAMRQNKRIVQIAEAIVSTAEILKA
jgi:AmiR/NasT family two-component response regulator